MNSNECRIAKTRLHDALLYLPAKNSRSIRNIAALHAVSYVSLQRASARKFIFQNQTPGRKRVLNNEEEALISAAVADFAQNDTPLSREYLLPYSSETKYIQTRKARRQLFGRLSRKDKEPHNKMAF